MGAIQIIHCLMLVSLLEPSLTHLQCPSTLSICHSNTYAQSRGKGEGHHQKQMPKLSSRGLQQSDYPISAVVWPDCCPGIFPSHRRFKDNILFRSRNHDSADQSVSHTAESADGKAITQDLQARLCPLLSLGQTVTAIALYRAEKELFFLIAVFCLLLNCFQFAFKHNCITETELIFANGSSEEENKYMDKYHILNISVWKAWSTHLGVLPNNEWPLHQIKRIKNRITDIFNVPCKIEKNAMPSEKERNRRIWKKEYMDGCEKRKRAYTRSV